MNRPTSAHRGAALTEFALLMPLLLGLTLGIIQLSLMAQARLVIHAAATAAARAAVADPYGRQLSPERAAEVACAGVAGPTLPGGMRAPAWERTPGPRGLRRLLARGPASQMKTRAKVQLAADEAVATVEHDYELLIPGVNRLFVHLERGWTALPGSRLRALGGPALTNRARSGLYGSPHLQIRATARLPAPWLGPRGIRAGSWPAKAPPRRRP